MTSWAFMFFCILFWTLFFFLNLAHKERWTKTSGRRERDHQVILDMVGGILARGMLLHCEICLFTEEIHLTVYRWFHLPTNRTQKPDFTYPLQIREQDSGQAKLRIRLLRFTVLLLGHLMKLEIPPQRRLESLSSVILRWSWMAARRSVCGFQPSFSFVFMWLGGLLEEVTVNLFVAKFIPQTSCFCWKR